jgi:hypothetical protein
LKKKLVPKFIPLCLVNSDTVIRHLTIRKHTFNAGHATAHTKFFSGCLKEAFSKLPITHGLWFPRSPDLNLCYYFCRGHQKLRVYVNNPHSLQELEDNI